MKCLTLNQLYATLIAIGAKKIETRSWSTSFRGSLAIHAAKGPGDFGSYKAIRDLCGTQPFFDALMAIVPNYNEYCDRDAIFEQLPSGAIVAVCDLVAVEDTDWIVENNGIYRIIGGKRMHWPLTDQERAFGNYFPGRYAWLLSSIRALPEAIPARGALSLWNYEGEL